MNLNDIRLIKESNSNHEIMIHLINQLNSNPLNFYKIHLLFNLNLIRLFVLPPLASRKHPSPTYYLTKNI